MAALRAAAPIVAEIRDPIVRPGYVAKLARWLGMDLAEVNAVQRAAFAAHETPAKPGGRGAEQRSAEPRAGEAATDAGEAGGQCSPTFRSTRSRAANATR